MLGVSLLEFLYYVDRSVVVGREGNLVKDAQCSFGKLTDNAG